MIEFTKMEGLGNDYVYVDCTEKSKEEIDYILKVVPDVVGYLREISPVWDELERGERPHLI